MRVAIIGSGPAGFYAAEALLRRTDTVAHVDMFDRSPHSIRAGEGRRSRRPPEHQDRHPRLRKNRRAAHVPGSGDVGLGAT